jgi:hypothetical protein
MLQATRIRHARMTKAINAIAAPTIMKTVSCGSLDVCRYGAFAIGGTVGGG